MDEKAIKDLKEIIEGEVRNDPSTLCAYSVDASIYEIAPLAVVTPKTPSDVVNTLRLASMYRIPVISRGAGTGITGGCIGKGIVIDFSKYLNQVLEINIDEEFVICQSGVVQDQLNAALAPYGYRLGPDTSTGNRATIGGMFANNAAGAHSLRYGTMSDHVISAEAVMANGTLIQLGELSPASFSSNDASAQESSLYQKIIRIRNTFGAEIINSFPKLPRRVSGYNLDELVKTDSINLAKLVTGSEGTLCAVTEVKMAISKMLNRTGLCILHFNDIIEGMQAVAEILPYKPISIEMIDHRIITMARSSPSSKEKLEWLHGDPQMVLAVEFEDPGLEQTLAGFSEVMKRKRIGYSTNTLTSPQSISHVWDVRKNGLGLLLSKRTYSRAIAFIEDLSIPPEKLPDFMQKFLSYLSAKGKEAGIYGHAGAGCMHIRPYIDLRQPNEIAVMNGMMEDISSLVLEYKGAMSGEHGDGLVRSWLNKKMFGQTLYQALCEVKEAFDPLNLLNPGKVVNGKEFLKDLRISPETTIHEIKTFQDFTPEGGFSLAADLCNGNGQCRKTEGLMCPSFQATGDEFDSTRARAQALRAVINGRWKIEDFASQKVGSVMDLCLECKGCKTECPSQVDMAKMKVEHLYQIQEAHGYSLRNQFLGNIALLYRIAQPAAGLFNLLSNTWLAKKTMSLLGLAPQRNFPQVARRTFSQQMQEMKTSPDAKQVVLFVDTFTEFNVPEIGRAAHLVLSLLGYNIIIPPWTCCGRPLISKGILKQARRAAERLIDVFYDYAHKGLPIVGLEPSCILTLIDDIPAIISPEYRQKATEIAKQCLTFDEFLSKHIVNNQFPLSLKNKAITAKIHGHCHQKALIGMGFTKNVLNSLPGLSYKEIPSGCCGMAGSFGYEKEHFDLSMKIGSLKLFPEIQSASDDAIIIANGFSCRCQIEQGTGRKALHLAELIGCMLR